MGKSKVVKGYGNTKKSDQDYYVKYHHDHAYIIRDNKLKFNVEVLIGKQTFYCGFHDTRSAEHVCEHIHYIKIWEESKFKLKSKQNRSQLHSN
jgi:hypothetical protein